MPAEIWRRNPHKVSRLIMSKHEIVNIELDPQMASADTNRHNNFWPPKPIESRFKLFKRKQEANPMQRARDEETKATKDEAASDKEKSDEGKDE